MKKHILIAVSLLALTACTKKSSSTSGTSGTSLNSTETQLVGTWYLEKEELKGTYYNITTGVFGDTTYTGYNSSYYMMLKSDQLVGSGAASNWKQETISFNPVSPMVAIITGAPAAASGYWYFETSSSTFHIVAYQFTVDVLTSTKLVLKQSGSSGFNYYHFKK